MIARSSLTPGFLNRFYKLQPTTSVMSFGFSVSDFIAVGGVIADIISSLKDSTGSKSDYQELIRELDALDRALKSLDKLQPTTSTPGTVDSIKCAALCCRVPLEQFLGKIKEYEVTLGPRTSTSSIASSSKAVVRKITWLGKAEEIDRLRKYLNVHLMTINILLLEHGLQALDDASKDLQEQCGDIKASLRGIGTAVNSTAINVQSQTALIRATHGILASLFSMISGEVRSSLSQIARFTQNALLLSQRIFEAVIQLQASVSTITFDTRWTYFQAPAKVEDALGRVFPVPSEYSMCELHALLRCRFRKGPGRDKVQHGEFSLTDRRNKAVVDRTSMPNLMPGLDIIMSILIDVIAVRENEEACPIPGCSSDNTIPESWGGRTCLDCGRWFHMSDERIRPSTRKRHIEDLDSDESSDDYQEDDSESGRQSASQSDVGYIRNVSCVRVEPRAELFQKTGREYGFQWNWDGEVKDYTQVIDGVTVCYRDYQRGGITAKLPQDIAGGRKVDIWVSRSGTKHPYLNALSSDTPVHQVMGGVQWEELSR